MHVFPFRALIAAATCAALAAADAAPDPVIGVTPLARWLATVTRPTIALGDGSPGFWTSARAVSAISPMTAVVQAGDGLVATATVDDAPLPMTPIAPGQVEIDVPLRAERSVALMVGDDLDIVASDAIWTITDVDGAADAPIALRQGDALRLRSRRGWIFVAGPLTSALVLARDLATPFRFDGAGTYRVVARAADGTTLGSLRVTALAADTAPRATVER